ncbi:transglutaminase [Frateuria sp. Soil773]|nr:transglutaminase [Frateuria sp. Soil773]
MAASAEPAIDARAFDLLAATIAVVLVAHAPHLPVWLAAALAAMLGIRWWQRRRRPGRASPWLKLPLIALLAGAVVFSYGTIFGREPGSALAVGLLVLKLLETEASRDARVGIGFGCFALMAALLFGQGLLATILVMLGLLPALAALRALEPAHAPASLPRTLLPGLGLLAAALPLAILAFLLVPRLSTPLWGAPNTGEARTGLGDTMSPGEFSELLVDDSPALRVNFDGAPPPAASRYFRAYVMWDYDGRRWRRGETRQAPAPLVAADAVGYQVAMESAATRVLPALDVPLEAPSQARLSADREIFRRAGSGQDALTYRLRSALHYRLQPDLPDPVRQRGLRLPQGFNPRAIALAVQWRQRYGNDDRAIVQAALALFHDGGFRYTLAPVPLGRDAMDDFLFDTREGFCEHYASAFAVLMRAAGIPARVVTGYQGGYWNRTGSYLLVRNSDAHAWGEVWLSGSGWVRIDPTAAVRPERVSLGAAAAAGNQLGWYRGGWLRDLRNRWDIVNRWWNQGVIGFDALRQRGLLTPFGVRRTDSATLGALLAAACGLFAGIGLLWALRRRQARDPVLAAMRMLERKLAGRGIVRRPSEGPQHYFSRAARALPQQRGELERLMRRYLDLRYAHAEPPPELARAFQRAARDFRPRRVVK